MKTISRQQRGRPARIDLSETLSDLLPVLREAAGPAVLIESVPSREPCVAVSDPNHLRAVLLDLATNARDAMPRGARWRLETGTVELDPDAALYAIVSQHGGCVNVTSEPGDTMFEILLPSPR